MYTRMHLVSRLGVIYILGHPENCIDAYAQSLSDESKGTDIQYRELLAALNGCRMWGAKSSGKHMIIHSDNRGVCLFF